MPETLRAAKGLWTTRCDVRRACHNEDMEKRFLTLVDVQEALNISSPQAYALVRSGQLPAIQVGGRGQWRVEAVELEAYIQRQYQATRTKFDTGAVDG
jgi:excisionase family DNA binding protein